MDHPVHYVPRRSERHTGAGWGIAGLVIAAAIAINAWAAYVHYSSHRRPTDVMFRAVGTAPAAQHGGAHGE